MEVLVSQKRVNVHEHTVNMALSLLFVHIHSPSSHWQGPTIFQVTFYISFTQRCLHFVVRAIHFYSYFCLLCRSIEHPSISHSNHPKGFHSLLQNVWQNLFHKNSFHTLFQCTKMFFYNWEIDQMLLISMNVPIYIFAISLYPLNLLQSPCIH